ncbi:uncharacterized protein AAGF69_016143 [Amazona ochrocephala]
MGLLKNSPQAFLPFLCPGQVFSSNYRVAMAVISLQRRLRAGMSALKQIMTLRKERLFKIFCLMSLTALAGAWCGTSLLMGRLCGKNAPQGRPAAVLSSLWNTPDVWKGQAGEMQQLRDEVTHLAAEIRSIKKGDPALCKEGWAGKGPPAGPGRAWCRGPACASLHTPPLPGAVG